jgi:hypothetical protein
MCAVVINDQDAHPSSRGRRGPGEVVEDSVRALYQAENSR